MKTEKTNGSMTILRQRQESNVKKFDGTIILCFQFAFQISITTSRWATFPDDDMCAEFEIIESLNYSVF